MEDSTVKPVLGLIMLGMIFVFVTMSTVFGPTKKMDAQEHDVHGVYGYATIHVEQVRVFEE